MPEAIATIGGSPAQSEQLKAAVEANYDRMDPEVPAPHKEAEHTTFTMCSCCTE